MSSRDEAHESDARLSRACRAVLRGASLDDGRLREHVDGCGTCREWLRRRAALQRLLAMPVRPPAELHRPEMVTRIRERVIEQCERSPLGRALEEVMPVAPLQDRHAAWPEPLLESELVARLGARPVDEVPLPDWGAVRAAVLDDIAGHAASRSVRQRALVGLGVVAALTLSVIVLRDLRSGPEVPEIGFADVASVPDGALSPIALLRNGGQK